MKTLTGQLESGSTAPAPGITCRLPEENPTGTGVVIFPGGAYGNLAEHEGRGYADFLCAAGIAAFVVNYRLGSQGCRHPAMLEDGLAAMAAVRSSAAELNLAPDQIGVMGSSAGGHLAAQVLTCWPRYAGPVSLKPAFGILCYPVIASYGPYAHAGSMHNLLGENPSRELLESVSCEKLVSKDAPPCFIWHTGEDMGVPPENSLLFAHALRRQRIPFELHIYQRGVHGLGLNTSFDWGREALRWIKEITERKLT
jgi:acetyl esterase/lipase